MTRRKQEEKRSLIMSKWSASSGQCWSGEQSGAHVFEEVLNDNNNAPRGQARNNSGGEKKEKAFVVLWEWGGGETEKERCEEQPRGGGAQFRQEIPAEKKLASILTTQHRANCYTQTLMCMHTRSQTDTQTLICSTAHSHWAPINSPTCYVEFEQKCHF